MPLAASPIEQGVRFFERIAAFGSKQKIPQRLPAADSEDVPIAFQAAHERFPTRFDEFGQHGLKPPQIGRCLRTDAYAVARFIDLKKEFVTVDKFDRILFHHLRRAAAHQSGKIGKSRGLRKAQFSATGVRFAKLADQSENAQVRLLIGELHDHLGFGVDASLMPVQPKKLPAQVVKRNPERLRVDKVILQRVKCAPHDREQQSQLVAARHVVVDDQPLHLFQKFVAAAAGLHGH